MSDDIVARLRVLNHHAKKLAENESLHDVHREAFTRCEGLTWEAADEIVKLREALDAARIEVCLVRAPSTTATDDTDQAMREYAKGRGWDCFRGMSDEP